MILMASGPKSSLKQLLIAAFSIFVHRLFLLIIKCSTSIVKLQLPPTHLVLKGTPVKKIYVDGGFSNNVIYMKLLAKAFPELEIFSATVAQATALGAALAIHNSWNDLPVAENLVEMKPYSLPGNSHTNQQP